MLIGPQTDQNRAQRVAQLSVRTLIGPVDRSGFLLIGHGDRSGPSLIGPRTDPTSLYERWLCLCSTLLIGLQTDQMSYRTLLFVI